MGRSVSAAADRTRTGAWVTQHGWMAAPSAGSDGGTETPRLARSSRSVDRVLDAAQSIVVESGPIALTTTDVAQRAGVAVGTVYRYFEDRDAIVAGLHHRNVQTVAGWMRATLAEPRTSLADDVAALFETYSRVHRTIPGYQTVRTYYGLLPGRSHARQDAIARIATWLVAALAERHDLEIGPERFAAILRVMQDTDAVMLVGHLQDGGDASPELAATLESARATIVGIASGS